MRAALAFSLSLLAIVVLSACSGLPFNQSRSAPPTATPTEQAAVPVTSFLAAPPTPTSEGAQMIARTGGQRAIRCASPAPVTPSLTEGPFFKAGSPERTSLLGPGVSGTQLDLSGYVLTTDCKPVAHALLEFWQANAQGQYDNSGYTLRGHQYTDANGRYTLTTIIPGLYPGRTEHIHVKVQAPGGPVITTQLFFPDQPQNQADSIFNPSLVLDLKPASHGQTAEFNFVVPMK